MNPELNKQKIIINGRRSYRVQKKIENIMEELISDAVEKIEKERDRMDDSFSENSDGEGEMESEVEVQASEDPSDGSEVDEVALSARSCQFCNKLFSTKGNKEDHEKYVHKKGPISKLLQIG